MVEVIGRDGTWTFDGEILRIVPGRSRGVHKLRQMLGELAVPLEAVAGIAYEPARKGGALKLRLREGADPLLQAAGGALSGSSDPYLLTIENDRTGVAEFFAEDVRNYLLVEQVPSGPSDHYLLPGPGVPVKASGGDGSATFDGERIRLEWNWMSEASKQSAGSRQITLSEVASVELHPAVGLDNGHLRFRVKGAPEPPQPKHDPNTLMLWGFKKEGAAAIALAAAVVARLPHPSGGLTPPVPSLAKAVEPPPPAETEDHDALLRRLRDLGELHREGILTDEEFDKAKQALLRRF